MLTKNQFQVLYCCLDNPGASQRSIVGKTNLSLGSVNAALKELRAEGYVDGGNAVTERGVEALGPYKVDNAVIMAAGLSSRFAPISFERPKGMLTVLGEVLIERQIRQLHEAGIDDVTVVVGYMKEQFFYLEDELGVRVVVNPDYAERNNNSTIKRVADLLGNTYICSSDDYFTENPFERYVYGAYYAAVFEEGPTSEYCLSVHGRDDRIVGVTVGGEGEWVMMGHAYWDRAYSRAFTEVLDEVYDHPDTAGKLWEDIYAEHVERLPMVMRKYRHGVIWEFDSLDELKAFDPDFISNVDSQIMDNICSVLDCERAQITDIVPIKQGLTNLSFRFKVGGSEYVYRHPGRGTDEIINRRCETASQEAARALGIDTTYIYEDPDSGWKVSHYLEGRVELDYHDWDRVAQAMDMARTLHRSGVDTGYPYDMYEAMLKNIKLIDSGHRTTFKDFDDLLAMATELNEKALAHGARTCLCHNDFYGPNFLVADDGDIQLIDWEYSGMSDYASDLGVFVCCCDSYDYDDVMRVLALYFEGTPEPEDLFHCLAYFSVVGFYWFIWALYKEDCGDPVGEFLYLWYRYAKLFGAKARELAEELGY